jgi:TAP-like protein
LIRAHGHRLTVRWRLPHTSGLPDHVDTFAMSRVRNRTPALIVAATGDPRTTYQNSLHHAMTGSPLITLRGAAVHAVYANYGSACVDDAVNAYFRGGRLPAADRTCRR